MHKQIKEIIDTYPIISGMVTSSQLNHILNHLNIVLENELNIK
jgi:hypothetical protein